MKLALFRKKRPEEQEAAKEAEREIAEQRRQAHEIRRNRAQELDQVRVWLVETQARRHETETTIARVLKMPRNADVNVA